jgi:hypothetical protein
MPARAAPLVAGLAVLLLLGLSPAACQVPAAEEVQQLPALETTKVGPSTATLQPEGDQSTLAPSSSPGSAPVSQPAAEAPVPPALLPPATEQPPIFSTSSSPAGNAAQLATLTERDLFPPLLLAAAPGDEAAAVTSEQLAAEALEAPAFSAATAEGQGIPEDFLGLGAAAEPAAVAAPTVGGAAEAPQAQPERSNFCG